VGLKTWLGLKRPAHRGNGAEDEYSPAAVLKFAQDEQKQQRLRAMLRKLTPKQAVGVEKVRIGCPYDGGYVMLDDFGGVVVAVSCGVGINWAWDHEVAERGIRVRQFDEKAYSDEGEWPLIDFTALRISGSPGTEQITLDEIVAGLNAAPAMALLKIDIEGAEWDVFESVSDATLSVFSQIVVEFHGLGQAADGARFSKYEAAIDKLNRHFQSVHVHGNNHSPFVTVHHVAVPDVLEVSFASRRRFEFADCVETFPTEIDMPNRRFSQDLWLGTFTF
jgi:Methyltransferase FkbM domain